MWTALRPYRQPSGPARCSPCSRWSWWPWAWRPDRAPALPAPVCARPPAPVSARPPARRRSAHDHRHRGWSVDGAPAGARAAGAPARRPPPPNGDRPAPQREGGSWRSRRLHRRGFGHARPKDAVAALGQRGQDVDQHPGCTPRDLHVHGKALAERHRVPGGVHERVRPGDDQSGSIGGRGGFPTFGRFGRFGRLRGLGRFGRLRRLGIVGRLRRFGRFRRIGGVRRVRSSTDAGGPRSTLR